MKGTVVKTNHSFSIRFDPLYASSDLYRKSYYQNLYQSDRDSRKERRGPLFVQASALVNVSYNILMN